MSEVLLVGGTSDLGFVIYSGWGWRNLEGTLRVLLGPGLLLDKLMAAVAGLPFTSFSWLASCALSWEKKIWSPRLEYYVGLPLISVWKFQFVHDVDWSGS